jgi:hypothetical protein
MLCLQLLQVAGKEAAQFVPASWASTLANGHRLIFPKHMLCLQLNLGLGSRLPISLAALPPHLQLGLARENYCAVFSSLRSSSIHISMSTHSAATNDGSTETPSSASPSDSPTKSEFETMDNSPLKSYTLPTPYVDRRRLLEKLRSRFGTDDEGNNNFKVKVILRGIVKSTELTFYYSCA